MIDTRWFEYQAPTPDRAVRHKAIKDAETVCGETIAKALDTNDFDLVNKACLGFAIVIDRLAVDSEDKAAAIRELRMLRMAINEAIMANKRGSHSCGAIDTASESIRRARMWANAAIALEET